MQALSMINKVQRELRLPISAAITDPHAALILSYVNTVQRGLMLENCVWDELKKYPTVTTTDGTSTYDVQAADSFEIDIIRNLQIGTYPPLEKCSDDKFRAYKRVYTQKGQPLFYRIYSRSGGSIITVELCPVPDAIYTINAEILVKPKTLINGTDVTILDDDAIFLGTLMLARKDQGEDHAGDRDAFIAKLSPLEDNQGESNWGDVEPV